MTGNWNEREKKEQKREGKLERDWKGKIAKGRKGKIL